MKIFNKSISYKKIEKSKEFKRLKLDLENIDFKEEIEDVKKLKLKLKKAKFTINIGLGEISVILVVIFSTILPFLFRSKIIEVDLKNLDYKILPEFNRLNFTFDGDFKISLRNFEIIKLLIEKWRKNLSKNRKSKKAYTKENLAL